MDSNEHPRPSENPLQALGEPPADPRRRLGWLIQALGEANSRRLGLFVVPEELVLSVVIPVYNEKRTIDEILRRVRATPITTQIILIDDCSTDGTRELLRRWGPDGEDPQPDLTVLFHERNQGKGAALRTGFRHATGDLVIVQDADLEYDPAEYPRLIEPIVDGRADVVFGSRFIGETHRVHLFWHAVANQGLTFLSNMFTNLNLTDMEVCYKVFRREVIQGITLKSDRFGFEPEVTAKVARFRFPDRDGGRGRKCRIYETPVSYHGRSFEEGKHIRPLRDGLRALYCIIRFAFAD
ncbi:glycosyltransferase family 2 protein [Tautonia plasticadhaerens]|uniref:Undecaprenyl-phosphate 4-deoxy-4-formamido-L-arabinose transferase n=1 Tax=Tautonia plasticadhaerens TaxID=2527974 RepID=A0A518GW57_9BACT|nr:glycosyltransferase family 2 protein [Tautonia plasticadhaerens]QDV32809.1 Undecaprenyl-phosphate 4-deoxy-4-formamido-L-arabinose transferase [Tautonia plasticadhaerens]